jgi:hypothetical protein
LDWYCFVCDTASTHLSGNGDLNLNTGLDVDDDLLDNLGGGVKARRSGSVRYSRDLYGVAVELTR